MVHSREVTPEPLISPLLSSPPVSPKLIEQLTEMAHKIRTKLSRAANNTASPPLSTNGIVKVVKFAKFAELFVLKGAVATHENDALHRAAKEKRPSLKGARWQLQKGGVMGVQKGRDAHESRMIVALKKEQIKEAKFWMLYDLALRKCGREVAKLGAKWHRERQNHIVDMQYVIHISSKKAAERTLIQISNDR
ncbi:MAG: hypothetical protein MMC33_010798 [Icmadophila ericetorum]|nr:hypothetical protein [Icmadophila ericetorum]